MDEKLASQHNDDLCSEIRGFPNEKEKMSFRNYDDGLLIGTIHGNPLIVVHTRLKSSSSISTTTKSSLVILAAVSSTCIRRHFYWAALSAECYGTVFKISESAQAPQKGR